jgi:5-methylthioadenosine/S-adenosylhomocysteine deaminase
MKKWSISGVTILSGDKESDHSTVLIENDKIEQVSSGKIESSIDVNISNGILVPGLINSHDHLLGTYLPKVGNGPYQNWLPWDNDLKSSPIYQERQQIENSDLYLLGAYRSILSGVTTVSDHIPHFVGDQFYKTLPMKALKNFSLAHSIGSFALKWGDEINVEYQRALEEDIPFITHISEGFDNETVDNITTIQKQGGLGSQSVFIHGIAFSESDMRLIKENEASVVWCADSNVFMFNETTNIKMLLDMGINVAIGTDSPMSGGLNLLHEMKYDKTLYENIYGEELSDETIFKMVTKNAAKALKMKENGEIKKGYIADLVVFKDKGGSAANSIVSAEMEDILLVIIDGKPVYGNKEYSQLFDILNIKYQHIIMKGEEKIIIGDLTGLLTRISNAVGFKKEFAFLPVEFEI